MPTLCELKIDLKYILANSVNKNLKSFLDQISRLGCNQKVSWKIYFDVINPNFEFYMGYIYVREDMVGTNHNKVLTQ